MRWLTWLMFDTAPLVSTPMRMVSEGELLVIIYQCLFVAIFDTMQS
jgi:hypothetical protein